jgi:autotransporter-associated beta strand protein
MILGKWTFIAIAVAATCRADFALGQLRAFGEAEGYGSTVTGGRAGLSVYHVTNLNDSGTGSFRMAVSVPNRIIVFDVSGVINLASAVSCQSDLTIAGQTAPGAGITLNGAEVSFSSQSNIICRYLRFRPGDGSSGSDDAVALYDSKNVILDHVSTEFAKYNNIDAVTDNGADPNITIQNSIIADPISNGSSTTGQGFGAHLEAVAGHFTLANNLWANSHNRNPLAKVDDQFVNNVDYNNNESYTTGGTSTPFAHDLVNNSFIFGPASTGSSFFQLSSHDTYYASGNLQDTNEDGVFNGTAIDPVTSSGLGTSKSAPNYSTTAGLPTLSASDAYAYVVAHAGASLVRDDLDNLVISQVQTLGNGPSGTTLTDPTTGANTSGPDSGLYHTADSSGLTNTGLGTIALTTRPTGFDSDNDGIADTWETAHGLSVDGTGAFKLNPLGYLMIEQYINELGSTNDTIAYTGGAISVAMDYGTIRGTGAADANLTLSTGTASLMKLSIGGNGQAAGEVLTVNGTGNLNVYDTIVVGDQNNAVLNIAAGTVSAYNIVLGNTVYSPTAVNNMGTINFSGGTLLLSQLVLGAGTPSNWITGGSMNWTGGTLRAQGTLNVNVPIALGSAGGTVDTNGFNGVISGVLANATGQAGALTKLGAGTLTLIRTNLFSGPTTVEAGSLIVTGSVNDSSVSVQGGTFGGTGSAGPLTLAAAGTVAPGNGGIGTLSVVHSAAIAGILAIDNSGSGSGSSDVLAVTGSLTLTGGTVSFTTAVALDDAAYVFAKYGTLTGTFAHITNLPSGYGINYAYQSDSIALVPTSSLPEPSISLLGFLPAALLRRRRV